MSLHRSSLVVIACLAAGGHAYAQPRERRVEVGGQVSTLHIAELDSTPAGFGGRVSYDLTSWASVESEVSFFPRDTVTSESPGPGGTLRLNYHRQRAEAFFGPKLGLRAERLGVFAKVRPGFARLTDQGVECAGEVCALATLLIARPEYRTELALDLGAVVEIYPSARMVARVDLGDTMIRHRSQAAPPCRRCTTHNFTSSIGLGFRF
jgi:hypothetical protein